MEAVCDRAVAVFEGLQEEIQCIIKNFFEENGPRDNDPLRGVVGLTFPEIMRRAGDLELSSATLESQFREELRRGEALCDNLLQGQSEVEQLTAKLSEHRPAIIATTQAAELFTMDGMAKLMGLNRDTLNNRLTEKRIRPTPRVAGSGRRPDCFAYRELRAALLQAYPDKQFLLPETFEEAKKDLQRRLRSDREFTDDATHDDPGRAKN